MPIEAHTDLSSLMTAPETMENEGQVLKTILEEKILKKSVFAVACHWIPLINTIILVHLTTAQENSILERAKLCLKISSIPKDGSDIYRFSNR